METGKNGMGLWWASKDGVKVTLYAQGGGSVNQCLARKGDWFIAMPGKVPASTIIDLAIAAFQAREEGKSKGADPLLSLCVAVSTLDDAGLPVPHKSAIQEAKRIRKLMGRK